MTDKLKQRVGQAAQAYLQGKTRIGVGTGTTVAAFIAALSPSSEQIFVSSSEQTTAALAARGIQVEPLNSVGQLDVYIDGTDFADPRGVLLKGGGAAQTKEKILAAASQTFVCMLTQDKLFPALKDEMPVVLEVLADARSYVGRCVRDLGGLPEYRLGVTTDQGHQILDVTGLDLTQPAQLEQQLNQIPGVVGHGLFVTQRAHTLLVAGQDGQVQTLTTK